MGVAEDVLSLKAGLKRRNYFGVCSDRGRSGDYPSV